MPRKTVKLEHGVECLAQPCFLIEQDGALYLAVAVLEYNALDATSPKKQEGVAHVTSLFETGVGQSPLRACALNDDGTLPPPGSSGESESPRLPGGPGGPVGPGGPGGPGGPPPPLDPPPPPGPPGVQTEPPGVQTSP